MWGCGLRKIRRITQGEVKRDEWKRVRDRKTETKKTDRETVTKSET